jgi:cell division protein FtsN
MKIRSIFNIILLTASLIFYAGCNSPIYEIVEVEEKVDVVPETKSETPINESTEIKSENIEEKSITEETIKSEYKYEEKQVVSRKYVVQIGAYIYESSAEKLIRRASMKIADPNISYKLIDGLYKVRLSKEFTDKTEAIEYLKTIWDLRFTDSFVVEVTRVKTE